MQNDKYNQHDKSNQHNHYDLIIVGGGLVGAGLALALRNSSLNIALIDAKDPNHIDQRLFALNASSSHFLENIHLWDSLEIHATPIHEVNVSYQGRFGSLSLTREDIGLSTLGHVIPAKHIESAFQEKLKTAENITHLNPAHLKTLKIADNEAHLTIEIKQGELELTTPLVIAADGSQSTVRKELFERRLNIPIEIFDYEQSAIVTQTTLKRSHQSIAYERFNAEGAIAMLPMQGETCATIWTVNNTKAKSLMTLSDEDFLKELSKAFGYRLGRLVGISKRHFFPLQKVLAKESYQQNVLLIGNALHTLHPIAAQGFNLALYEVAKLTEAILEKTKSEASSFTASDLEKISEEMKKHQAMSVGLSHHLTQLFSKQSSLLTSLLSIGMLGIDLIDPLKKRLLDQMLARRGSVPRLLMRNVKGL